MSRRFARVGWPRGALNVAAVITASATPHAEGAYTQLTASTAQDISVMELTGYVDVSTSATDTSMLLTLAIGAAASEVDVIANIAMGGAEIGRNRYWLPLHIPAGTRIAAKLRAEQVSDTFGAFLTLNYGSGIPGWGGYSVCEAIGADTANSRGTPINTAAGAYTAITASTTNPLRAISASFGLVDNANAGGTHVVDVAVGGAGSEVIIGTWQVQTDATEGLFDIYGPPWVEVPIAAGSRLAVKKQTAAGNLSVVLHGWS